MSNNFIKLDRKLIRVLGLNKAVVFCHLLGIQNSINKSRGKQDAIYQQQERLLYDTGLSKATLIKVIKELENQDKLLHTIKGTEGNKTQYFIDEYSYKKLLECIDDIENKNIKKTKTNASSVKRDVLKLYYEWVNNNTTSSDNFNTTNKDLKEKKNRLKKDKTINRQLLSNCKHKPITINYYDNNIFDESITYQFIPLLFKDEYNNEDIYDLLCNNSKNKNISKDEINTLEYFLKKYYQYYGTIHRQTTAPKIREILQNLYQVLSYTLYSKNIKEIIDEYFNTPNTKQRDLTIYLFLSKNDNGLYSWINKLAIRLEYIEEDIY